MQFFLFLKSLQPQKSNMKHFFLSYSKDNSRNLEAGVEVDIVLNGSVVNYNYRHRHFIACTDMSIQTCSMLLMHKTQMSRFWLTPLKTGQLLFENNGFGVKVDRTTENLCLVVQTFYVALSCLLFAPKRWFFLPLDFLLKKTSAAFLRYIPMHTYIVKLLHKKLELTANVIMAWIQS